MGYGRLGKFLKRENLEIMDEFTYPSVNWMNCAQWHDVYWILDTEGWSVLGSVSQRMHETKKGHGMTVSIIY